MINEMDTNLLPGEYYKHQVNFVYSLRDHLALVFFVWHMHNIKQNIFYFNLYWFNFCAFDMMTYYKY